MAVVEVDGEEAINFEEVEDILMRESKIWQRVGKLSALQEQLMRAFTFPA